MTHEYLHKFKLIELVYPVQMTDPLEIDHYLILLCRIWATGDGRMCLLICGRLLVLLLYSCMGS